MTEDDLRDAIAADPAALAFAQAGDDGACAARLAAIHTETFDHYINELGVLKILGPMDGDAALVALEGTPGTLTERVVRLVRSAQGLNISDPMSHAFMDNLVLAGRLQASWVAALKAAGVRPLSVTTDDVSRAWAVNRPDGKVGG